MPRAATLRSGVANLEPAGGFLKKSRPAFRYAQENGQGVPNVAITRGTVSVGVASWPVRLRCRMRLRARRAVIAVTHSTPHLHGRVVLMRAVPAGAGWRGAAWAVLVGLMTWAVAGGQAPSAKDDQKTEPDQE